MINWNDQEYWSNKLHITYSLQKEEEEEDKEEEEKSEGMETVVEDSQRKS